MTIPTLRVGGVPEHFNFPWRMAHSHLGFQPQSVDFAWEDYYGGTGYLREDLHAGKLDLAVMLTEGALADINLRDGLKIVGQYVSSSLHWGVHVHADHPAEHPEQLIEYPFAISRMGSGSHLMAYVYAQRMGWPIEQLEFVSVKNLKGAQEVLAKGEAGAFLWEKFTTKPLVDSGEWRRLDLCLTPWPSFVVVGREEILKAYGTAVQELLGIMQRYLTETSNEEIIRLIHEDLKLDKEDLKVWLAQTEWECQPIMQRKTLEVTEAVLHQVGQVLEKKPLATYLAPFTELQEG